MIKLNRIMIFLKTLGCFITHRNFENVIHNIVQKYTSSSKSQLRKYETFSIKVKKAQLDFNFLSNCCLFNVIPKFLTFNLPYSNDGDTRFIRKILLRSAIKERRKERMNVTN